MFPSKVKSQLSVIAVVLGFAFVSFSQDGVPRKVNSPNKCIAGTSFQKVVDQDGWDVPANIASVEIQPFTKRVGSNNILVRTFTFKPRFSIDNSISLFKCNENGVLVHTRLTVELRELSALSLREKTFAYRLEYLQVGISEKGDRAYFGPLILLYLVDGDGDGKFETRVYSPSDEMPSVPGWV